MSKKSWAVIAAAALVLATLACATPDLDAGGATGQAVQQTVIAELTLANVQITPDDSDVTQGAGFVQTAIAAKINATIDASIAGTQTALAPQPVPATITLAATQEQAQPTDQPPQPTTIPPTNAASTGAVSGKLCYPASFLPALTIYAKNLGDGSVFQQENPENQSQYTLPNLPEGDYFVFAYTHPGTDNTTSVGIGYTEFVTCGLLASCTDHAMIAVPVYVGETTTDVDICDGYDASAIPPRP